MTAHNTIRFEGIWGYPSCKAKFDAAPPSPERHWSRRLRSHGHSLKVPEPSEDWWKGWNFQLCNHLCRMDQLFCIPLRCELCRRMHTGLRVPLSGWFRTGFCTRNRSCDSRRLFIFLPLIMLPSGTQTSRWWNIWILCLMFLSFFRWSSPHLFVDLSGEIQGPNPGWIFRAPGFSWANVSRMRPGKSPKWTCVDIMHKNPRLNWWIFQLRLITKYY